MISDFFRTARGIVRSLRIYYGDRQRSSAMDRLYANFISPGDLVFDVGAHVGDRIGSFRRLGARVVAVEPQPALVKILKLLYGRDPMVSIKPVAIGHNTGAIELMINIKNPTISTASTDFVTAARDAIGWEGQAWTKKISVPLTTLDVLISHYGLPAFIKIDIEGFEAQALTGLTQPPPALSFEFTTIQREVALDCIERCTALGLKKFNAVLGESQKFVHIHWISGHEIMQWLRELPHEANSGDIYATRT